MHHARFKRLLQEFFAEFFWLFFPTWAARFDFTRMEWLDKELVSDIPAGESRYVDVVAKLPTLQPVPGPDGRSPESWRALVHVEVEAADTVAPLRRRMFEYYEPLRHRHDLPVLPVALYLRVGLDGIGWDAYEEHFWDHLLVRFNYPYVGLPALDAEPYLRQDNWLGVALSALMRVPPERRIALAAEAMDRLVRCPENTYRKTLLCECVGAYLPVDEAQRRELDLLLQNHPDPGVRAMTLSLLDHAEQRGEQRGEQCGEQRGILKGQRELLRKLLETRFGPLSRAALARLENWPPERLTDLGRALLSATSLQQFGFED